MIEWMKANECLNKAAKLSSSSPQKKGKHNMALAIINTQVPTLNWKRESLANISRLGKPYRISPIPSPISPTSSKPRNALQAKAQISTDKTVLSEVEFEKYPYSSDHKPHNSFPPDFAFGAASSNIQVEGGIKAGGKGPNIWDTFCEDFPEKITDRSSTEPASGSYYHYKDDVKALAEIGLNSYRFSISWSRVLPKGRGQPNIEGIGYYHKLIDELKRRGIEPYVTLFHWDLPQALENEYGGFLSRKIVEDYKNFSKLCFEEFGHKVKHWITMNEPYMFASLGYGTGIAAPGHCTPDLNVNGVDYICPNGDSLREPYQVLHNMLLAHAETVHLYRTQYQAKQKGKVGITLNSNWFEPYDNSQINIEAQQRVLDFNLGWPLDPVMFGDYPFIVRALVRDRLPYFTKEESKKLAGSYDFIGINYYTARYVKAVPYNHTHKPKINEDDSYAESLVDRNGIPIGPAEPGTWVNVYPKGLKKLLLYIKNRYNNPPIYITENGVFESTTVPNDTTPIDDIYRIEYHTSHLHELEDAISRGVDVKGYFVWSLLDSFEWSSGYTCRFGLVYINNKNLNEPDLKRIPKRSTHWLKRFLSNIHGIQAVPAPLTTVEVVEPIAVTSNNP